MASGNHSRTPEVKFCFDVVCPYAYLASLQLPRIVEAAKASLYLNPVLLGGLYELSQAPQGKQGSATDVLHPHKRLGYAKDLALQLGRNQAKFKFHPRHPVKSLNAMRLLAFAIMKDEQTGNHPLQYSSTSSSSASSTSPAKASTSLQLMEALYAAYWQRNEDIDKREVLEVYAKQFGLDLATTLENKAVATRLTANTQEAFEAGAFGVPSFIVTSNLLLASASITQSQQQQAAEWSTSLIFGADRLHFVAKLLGCLPTYPAARQVRVVLYHVPEGYHSQYYRHALITKHYITCILHEIYIHHHFPLTPFLLSRLFLPSLPPPLFLLRQLRLFDSPSPSFLRQYSESIIYFFFDVASPWSYLGWTQLASLTSLTKAKVRMVPILLGALFKSLGTPAFPGAAQSPMKQVYSAQDLENNQAWLGSKRPRLMFPDDFPLRTLLPQRILSLYPNDGALIDVLYTSMWTKNVNIGDAITLAQLLTQHGYDGHRLVKEATESQEAKDILKHNTDLALASHVIGVPSFIVAWDEQAAVSDDMCLQAPTGVNAEDGSFIFPARPQQLSARVSSTTTWTSSSTTAATSPPQTNRRRLFGPLWGQDRIHIVQDIACGCEHGILEMKSFPPELKSPFATSTSLKLASSSASSSASPSTPSFSVSATIDGFVVAGVDNISTLAAANTPAVIASKL